jgi:hypothetical protein
MDYELQFLIMVSCEFDIDQFLNRLKRDWQDVKWVKRSSFDLSDNWIQISENEDYDPALAFNTLDGFLHYRYRIEVSPIKETRSVAEQVNLAKTLKTRFEKMGCLAVICADFEELLGEG